MLASWMILNTINPQLVELKEPSTLPDASTPTWDKVRVPGTCADEKTYTVELYSQANYQPAGEPLKCYNLNESEKSFSKGFHSIDINGTVAIRLYDEANLTGKNICFTSSQPDLGRCYIDCPPGPSWFCSDSWLSDVKSLKIISAGECSNPGKTLNAGSVPEDPNEICR